MSEPTPAWCWAGAVILALLLFPSAAGRALQITQHHHDRGVVGLEVERLTELGHGLLAPALQLRDHAAAAARCPLISWMRSTAWKAIAWAPLVSSAAVRRSSAVARAESPRAFQTLAQAYAPWTASRRAIASAWRAAAPRAAPPPRGPPRGSP